MSECLSKVLITGESNIDEKNVKEVFNMCSTEQSCILVTKLVLYLQILNPKNLKEKPHPPNLNASTAPCNLLFKSQKPIRNS